MGNFDAAIQLAELTGGLADVAAVRTYTTKTGIAGNLEQQIVPEVGAFLRAGWTPGKLEPDAFTDGRTPPWRAACLWAESSGAGRTIISALLVLLIIYQVRMKPISTPAA